MPISRDGSFKLVIGVALALAAVACSGGGDSGGGAGGGDGKKLFVAKGCTACHVAPGIPEAVGTIGPSLAGVAGRPTIAGGKLPTSAENIKKWLKDPPAVKSDTQMPNLALTDAEIEALTQLMLTFK